MEINATLLAQTVAFIIFVWFCMKFVWPPINKAIVERQTKIANALKEAEQAIKDKENLQHLMEEELAHAKNQAQEIIALANKQHDIILANTEQEAKLLHDKIIADGYLRLEIEERKIKEELQNQYTNLVSLGVEKIIQRSVNVEHNQDIIDDLINQLK